MPIEDRWPLVDVLAAVRDHAEARGVRAMLAYVVIGGVNSLARARACARRAARPECRAKLSLIDVTDETGRYQRASDEELGAFRDALAALGIPVARRYSGGAEIGAACGTLAATRRGGQDALVQLRLRSEPASDYLRRGLACSQTSWRPLISLPVSAPTIFSASAGATFR